MWGQGRYRGHPVYGVKVSSPDRIYQILMPIFMRRKRIEQNKLENKRIEENAKESGRIVLN